MTDKCEAATKGKSICESLQKSVFAAQSARVCSKTGAYESSGRKDMCCCFQKVLLFFQVMPAPDMHLLTGGIMNAYFSKLEIYKRKQHAEKSGREIYGK